MSLELVGEMAAAAYDMFLDTVRDYILVHGEEPNVVHVSQAMEQMLTAHMSMNCNMQFPLGGLRGMSHIMGMRPIWDAIHFKLEREPCHLIRWSVRIIMLPEPAQSANSHLLVGSSISPSVASLMMDPLYGYPYMSSATTEVLP